MLPIPVDQVNDVILAQRLSAIALTCLFWDHFLTIDDEISFWGNAGRVGWWSKLAFFVNRYITEIVMLYTIYVTSGLTQELNFSECIALIWSFALCAILLNVMSHFIILFRIYSLWDRSKIIAWILIAVFLASVVVITTVVALVGEQLEASAVLIGQLRLCAMARPLLAKLLVGMLTLLDLFLAALTIYNGLQRPHHTHVDVIRDLQADGMRMFTFLVVIRLINLMVVLFGPPEYFVSVVSIAWALCSVINSRLHLRLEGLKFAHPPELGLVLNFK